MGNFNVGDLVLHNLNVSHLLKPDNPSKSQIKNLSHMLNKTFKSNLKRFKDGYYPIYPQNLIL